jgi:hypothetical protein
MEKAFDAMDQERCILILEGYGVGPKMIRLIRIFWRNAVLVCRASRNYGMPFQAGRGVTQGRPLSSKLFNILVDEVAREWLQILRDERELEEEAIDMLMATFFAIFYVDDAYLASRDPDFLQRALDVLVVLFVRVGLEANAKKTQTMICTPGRILTQLPKASYQRDGNESRALGGVATGHDARRSGGRGGGDRGPLADVCDFVTGSLGEG